MNHNQRAHVVKAKQIEKLQNTEGYHKFLFWTLWCTDMRTIIEYKRKETVKVKVVMTKNKKQSSEIIRLCLIRQRKVTKQLKRTITKYERGARGMKRRVTGNGTVFVGENKPGYRRKNTSYYIGCRSNHIQNVMGNA